MRRYLFPKTLYALLAAALVLVNITVYRHVFARPMTSVRILSSGASPLALIRTPHGAYLLLDTGRDASAVRRLGETLAPWQRSLDALILTNASTAEAGGAAAVLARYAVSVLVRTGAQGTRTTEVALAEINIPHFRVPYGAHITIDGVRITPIISGVTVVTTGNVRLRIASTTVPGLYKSTMAFRRD